MSNELTLALTKVGDLLTNRRITLTWDGSSIENVNLRIPEYQRPYKWTSKNSNQLLDDICDALKDNKELYRVGTLILHHNEDEGKYDIVDGQQRTITFSLLLKCLGCENLALEYVANDDFTIRNVANNYRTLKRRIEQLTNVDALSDYILKNCELIVVITNDLSEAFQFFDSQNARGKSLYPHDLLKAYHLREMNDLDSDEVAKVVGVWEGINQARLSVLFNDYLYRLKEWIKGNRANKLTEQNIDMFKGVSIRDNYPYAQFYKGAFSYADDYNNSSQSFVTGISKLSPFQINTPVIAGKPFFDYAKHYYDILADIQNNDKYVGYFINDNEIIKTLDLSHYRNGTGNNITRLMLDTAILLYVDRFCHSIPNKTDIQLLDQFVMLAFIWAYSMRAQYVNVGWLVAQNYILGTTDKDIVNSFNMYVLITEADAPSTLLSKLSDLLLPISALKLYQKKLVDLDTIEEGIPKNYLYFFKKYNYLEGINEEE